MNLFNQNTSENLIKALVLSSGFPNISKWLWSDIQKHCCITCKAPASWHLNQMLKRFTLFHTPSSPCPSPSALRSPLPTQNLFETQIIFYFK
jgi:hypothetical protein